jgi:hypothetical protein
MKNKPIFFGFLAIVGLSLFGSGCGKRKAEYESFFVQPAKNQKNITVKSLALDTISLVLPNTSAMGYSDLSGEHIYFADKFHSWVYKLDKEAQLVTRRVGLGRGPGEIPIRDFEGYAVSREGDHYFVGSTRDIYVLDAAFQNKSQLTFMPSPDRAKDQNTFERDDFYSLNYGQVMMKPYKELLYFNVKGGNSQNNISTPSYYKNARILMSVNALDGAIEQVFGRMSPAVKFMSAFVDYQYDVDDNGDFYVGFEADSLIYVYDNQYRIRYSFGHSGTGMNTDYLELSLGREYPEQASAERVNKGYYTSLKKAGEYLFRTYKTGGVANSDRMQIYKGRRLIGDVAVPVDFAVMGYIAPYYYSHIVTDEYDQTLTLYRFRMD